jgi:glucose dehydrogenase
MSTDSLPHSSLVFVASGKYVQALDRASGRPVWQRKLPASIWSSGFTTLMAEGQEVFVGRSGYVYCLDAATGQVLWERGVGSSGSLVVMASPSGDQAVSAAAAMAAQQAASIAAVTAATTAAAAAS